MTTFTVRKRTEMCREQRKHCHYCWRETFFVFFSNKWVNGYRPDHAWICPMSVSVWEVIHYSTNCNRRSLSLSLCVCVHMCVSVCLSLFWDPILFSYTPSPALQLAPSPPSLSLAWWQQSSARIPSPKHATPPPPSPFSFVKTISAGREREGKSDQSCSVREEPISPPAVCVHASMCVSAWVHMYHFCTCGFGGLIRLAWVAACFWFQTFSVMNVHVGTHADVQKIFEFSPSLITWEVKLLPMTFIDLVHWS